MSEWTDIRDKIVDALDLDEVTEQVKQDLTRKLVYKVLPEVKVCVDKFVSKIREQATNENGWCRVRDGIVLPLVLNCTVWAVETILTKTITETAQE